MIAWRMLSVEVSIIVFPEKGSACDEALAVAIYALIPLVTLVVTVVMAVLIWLTITGELSLILLDQRRSHIDHIL